MPKSSSGIMSRDGRDRGTLNLKDAASLLTKGGTLINDPCRLCSGVQVKYRGKVICVNCGNEKIETNKPVSNHQKKEVKTQGRGADEYESPNEQYIHASRQDFEELGPTIHERKATLRHRNNSHLAGLRNLSILLIERTAAEIANTKDEKDPEILKRKAEVIRVFLGLLRSVREIERL